MGNPLYNTPYGAHRLDVDCYLPEGELIFLKKLVTETTKFYSNESVKLNLFTDVISHFQNSPMWALKRLWLYTDAKFLSMKVTTKLNFEKPYKLEELLSGESSKPKQEKQLELLELLKKHEDLKNLSTNNRLLRLLTDRELLVFNGFIEVLITDLPGLRQTINTYLDIYLKDYFSGQLKYPGKSIYSKKVHVQLFQNLLNELSVFEKNAIYLSKNDVEAAARKYIDLNVDTSCLKPLEFLFLLEQGGFIKLIDFDFPNNSLLDGEQDWEVEFSLIKPLILSNETDSDSETAKAESNNKSNSSKEQEIDFLLIVRDREIWVCVEPSGKEYLIGKPHGAGIRLELLDYVRKQPANKKITRESLDSGLKKGLEKERFLKILIDIGFKGLVQKIFFKNVGKDSLCFRGDKVSANDLVRDGIDIKELLSTLEKDYSKSFELQHKITTEPSSSE